MKLEEMQNNYGCCFNEIELANQQEEIQFNSAEETWFWFCKYNGRKDGFRHESSAKTVSRPCFLDDVYVVVTRLFFSGKIAKNHMNALVRYGKRQVVPDGRIFEEAEDAQLWREAMTLMEPELVRKGIVRSKTDTVGMTLDVVNMEVKQ